MERASQTAGVLRCGAFELSSRGYAPRAIMPPHAHDCDKVSMFVAGEVEERAGRYAARCGAGVVFARPAGFEHADAVGEHGLRMLVIRRVSKGDGDELWQSALRAYQCRRDPALGALLFPLFARLLRGRPADGGEDWQILDVLARLRGDARGGGGVPAWVRRVRDALHAGFASRVSVEALAAELRLHPVYVARVFRRATNRTISQYVGQLRVQHAATLLAEGNRPQAEIALACGPADQPHLCRLFRRHFGLTPGAFRRAVCGQAGARQV